MTRTLGWSLIAALALAQGTFAQTPRLQPRAAEQIRALLAEKASRTPEQRKIDSGLLHALQRDRDDPRLPAVPEMGIPLAIDAAGRVLVDLRAEVTAGLLEEIRARGGSVLSSVPELRSLRIRIPLAEVENLARADEVEFIRRAALEFTRKINTSEGDLAHAADLARLDLGVDGGGVRVGVISDGVASLADRQATGDLPPIVTVLAGFEGSGDEGTAMLEIVFDLAPGAELLFASGSGTEARMAEAIRALRDEGADIIVDDLGKITEPVFQDGVIARAVEEVSAQGVIYLSAAGNAGNFTNGTSGVFEGDYSGTALPPVLDGGGASAHEFGTGINFNTLTEDSPFAITLHWSDPLGGSANDYDLFLLDSTLSTVLAASTDSQTGTQDPFEAILSLIPGDPPTPIDHSGSQLVVVKFSGEDRFFHLNTLRGELLIATAGQIFGHPATDHGFGVAAVDVATADGGVFTGLSDNPVEPFSSDGNRRIFFETDGSAVTPGNFSSTGGRVRRKPDITAADGVSTSTPGFNPFHGTSAAAPHAAAIAALMIELGNLTPEGVRDVFASTALDVFPPGIDQLSGVGILHARDAVGTVLPAAATCFADHLILDGTPNDGPQTFRACQSITAAGGVFDQVTLIAQDGSDPGTVILGDGFVSGDLVIRTSGGP